MTWDDVKHLSDKMAEDEGLWFIARTATEAYLQQELRKLCAAIDETSDYSRELADERFQELKRAQSIIDGLKHYRESLLTCSTDLEPVGRARIRELSTPPRDDRDRAVLMLLGDYERLLKAVILSPAQKGEPG